MCRPENDAATLDTTDTVSQAVRRWAAEYPGGVAVQAPSRALTWSELDGQARRCAGWLRAQGIGAGDRVAWLGRNTPEAAVIYLALRRLRAAMIGLNWRLAPVELAATAAHLPAAVILAEPDRAVDAAALPGNAPVHAIGDPPPWAEAPEHPGFDLPADDDEVALFWFTSGSTGVPKAVAIGAGRIEYAVALDPGYRITTGDQLLIVPPIFHAAGSVWLHHALSRGATAHFVDDAGPAGLVDALIQRRISHMLTVPTLLAMVVDELERRPGAVDMLELRQVAYGTAPMSRELLRRAIRLLRCEFTGVYGLTEAGGVLTYLPAAEHDPDGPHTDRLDSVGRAIPGTGIEVSIRTADGEPSACGETGHVWFVSPTVMLGYWRGGHPERRYGPDNLCATGDLGHLDADGYLYLEGRADDVIITGGENVSPAEVEGVLATMPGIAECGVYGMADDTWGQVVAAAVVPCRPGSIEPQEVIDFARPRLAGYKRPRRVAVVDELPRSATGKLLRGRIAGIAE